MKLLNTLLLTALVLSTGQSASAQGGAIQQPAYMYGYALGTGLASQLLSNKDLQEELHLSEGQIDKLKEFAEKKTTQKGGAWGGYGGWGGGDQDLLQYHEQQIKAIKERIEFVQSVLEKKQFERLNQLETQKLGYRAFSADRIAKELKITDDQKKRFTEITTDLGKETQNLWKGMQGGYTQEKYAEIMKKSGELNNFAIEAMEKELTDDQKAIWSQMTGKKFDVSKLTPQYPVPGKDKK